jgi:hypothetical protein
VVAIVCCRRNTDWVSHPLRLLRSSTSLLTYIKGVDNALQFTVVTSSGDYLTANAYQYPDLYWALRGGGGGTYGITTSVTYKTYPIIPLTSVFFAATSTTNSTVMTKLVVEFLRSQPSFSDDGWSGYSLFNGSGLVFFYLSPNGSSSTSMEAFFSFSQNLTSEGLTIQAALTVPVPSFYDWYNQLFSNGTQVGKPTEIGSRLLSREVIEKNYVQIAQTYLNLQTGGANW